MSVSTATFPKAEHLCGEKRVDALFHQAASFVSYPFRVLWTIEPQPVGTPGGAVVLISVSKRKFKHAVDRNHIKRLVREAYRLHKHLLFESLEPGMLLQVAFIWIPSERMTFAAVENRMRTTLLRILSECTPHTTNHDAVETHP